jgi:hypothetical protein
VIILLWTAKYHIYYIRICYGIPKDLPVVFFSPFKPETCWFCKKTFAQTVREYELHLLIVYNNSIQCSHSWRKYAASRSSPRHTDQHYTFYNRRGCSWFSYLASTHIIISVSLWMASVANVSPLVDWIGLQMNLASLVKCHWSRYSPHAFIQSNLAPGFRGTFYVSFSHQMTFAISRHWEWLCPESIKTNFFVHFHVLWAIP